MASRPHLRTTVYIPNRRKRPISYGGRRPMTIGIGALCERKGCIVIASDMRLSFEGHPISPNEWVGKVFDLPLGLYASIAGTYSDCESIISEIAARLADLEVEQAGKEIYVEHVIQKVMKSQLHILEILCQAKFQNILLLTPERWRKGPLDARLYRGGKALIRATDIEADLLIAGFLNSGPIILRIIGKRKPDEEINYAAIGTGLEYAYDDLSKRGQGPWCNLARTLLHLSFAMEAARQDKGVGNPNNFLVILPQACKVFPSTSHLFAKWKNKYGSDSRPMDADREAIEEMSKEFLQGPLVAP